MEKITISCPACSKKSNVPSSVKVIIFTCPQCQKKWKWKNPQFHNLKMKVKDYSGISSGVFGNANNYADNVHFNSNRGHGFAAEKANHLHDVFTGKSAQLVGGDNAKNGADRIVNGVNVQTKYCSSGSKCVSEAFQNGKYRYVNDGKPMQLEVPSDMYDSAIQAMEERIRKGQVPGVSAPKQAKNLVRKGSFTYAQAKNIAKFGTIESLKFDAMNGISIAGTSMGISSAISFAVQLWNGEEWDLALKSACYDGLKAGGVTWACGILSSQAGRTGVEQSLRGTTDWLVGQLTPQARAFLATGLRNSGTQIQGIAATNYLSKLLRGNLVTGVITTAVLSSADFVRLFKGRVSGAQVLKNVSKTAAGVAGGTGGWMAGAALGASFGTAVPIIGNVAGGIIGGILGSFAGGSAATAATGGVLDQFIKDDAEEMMAILEKVFGELAFDYLLTETEATKITEELKALDLVNILRDMYASNDRKSYAKKQIIHLFDDEAKKRKKIQLPTDKQLAMSTTHLINELCENKA
ncbi:hypothetical protein [Photobacterium piscicola]|uniref:hypothetical protein n=1 Tax=Photobacterium piscicola TaxID=1378299 RepID=UPI0038CFF992